MTKQVDRSFSFCAVPLVTDDARFLILLATGPVFGSALRIYRQEDFPATQMEDGTLKAFWLGRSSSMNCGQQRKLSTVGTITRLNGSLSARLIRSR
jgi:hypothetical protein